MNYKVYGNELYHHGILGQKWGVRRYQNTDGTYTSAGKARRNSGKGSVSDDLNLLSKTSDRINNRIKPTKKAPSQEEIDEMSDEELRRQVNRKRLEKEYSNLNTETVNDGKSKVKEVLETASIALSSAAALIDIYYTVFGRDAAGPSIKEENVSSEIDNVPDMEWVKNGEKNQNRRKY